MPEVRVVPSPLLISQARSAHPFFVGSGALTARSKNLWPDERQRLLRRPALVRYLDAPRLTPITSLFEYQYRSRSSRPVRLLVGFEDELRGITVPTSQRAQLTILSENMDQGVDSDGSILNSRWRFSDASAVYTPNITYKFGELVDIYYGGTGSADGTLWTGSTFAAQMLVDNLDYAGVDGEVIIRSADVEPPSSTSYRIVGRTSGTNARFATRNLGDGAQMIWRSSTDESVATAFQGYFQSWRRGAVVTMVQFGSLLLFTDDTFLYPVRVWTGARQQAQYMIQAPKAGLITTHQGRVVLADLERNGAEVALSGIGNPYSWSADGSIDGPISLLIEQDDRDNVTGVAQSFRGDLYIWKTRSLHRIVGTISFPQAPDFTPSFRRETVTRSIGCVSQRSIVHVGNDIFWMSERGFHSLSATDKYGDVEETYISFPIADVFEIINYSAVKKVQAIYEPRLGLYLVGIPTNGSEYMNLLLGYSVASGRWMSWDIGEFSSLAVGPPVGSDALSVYVCLVDEVSVRDGSTYSSDDGGWLTVLDFAGQTDFDASVNKYTLSNIPVVIEPGDLFANEQDPSVRYQKKSVNRIQLYLTPPGDFTADVIYSWDGGKEITAELDLNPQGLKSFGSGFALGEDEVGNELTSEDDTTVSSVSVKGRGHLFRYRIEDSNPGVLPYLHADLEAEIHTKDYTAQVRP